MSLCAKNKSHPSAQIVVNFLNPKKWCFKKVGQTARTELHYRDSEKTWNKQTNNPMVDNSTLASSAKLFVIQSPWQCARAKLWGDRSINSTVYLLSFHPSISHGYRKAHQVPPVKTSDRSWWTKHDAKRRRLIASKLFRTTPISTTIFVQFWMWWWYDNCFLM